MKEKRYEKPQILETISIEEVLMDEEVAPEWVNWGNSWNNWRNVWQNTGAISETKTTEGDKKG